MARILICHVPKDGSVARDLGSALMGRGHFVSFDGEPDQPRDDRSARLRQFEAVIVVWTETSAQNAGLSEIARAAMPLNQLVPVRAEDLSPARLPLMFRKLSMIAPRDIDGIARVVARMSTHASSLREMTEHETARRAAGADKASSPFVQGSPYVAGRPRPKGTDPAGRRLDDTFDYKPSQDKPVQNARAQETPVQNKPAAPPPVVEASEAVWARPLLALPEVDADAAAHGERQTVPPSAPKPAQPSGARKERPSTAVVTAEDLGRAVDSGLLVQRIPGTMWLGEPATVELTLDRDFIAGLSAGSQDLAEVRQSLETLSLSLYGETDAFDIERQSERTQFVNLKALASLRDPATIGRWAWLVTPRAAGAHDVVVRVSALMRDRNGVPAPVALPDRRFSITVDVPANTSLVSAIAGWVRR
jgi:hypothetical protein